MAALPGAPCQATPTLQLGAEKHASLSSAVLPSATKLLFTSITVATEGVCALAGELAIAVRPADPAAVGPPIARFSTVQSELTHAAAVLTSW